MSWKAYSHLRLARRLGQKYSERRALSTVTSRMLKLVPEADPREIRSVQDFIHGGYDWIAARADSDPAERAEMIRERAAMKRSWRKTKDYVFAVPEEEEE